MSPFEIFMCNVQEFLADRKDSRHIIIKKIYKKLEEEGDLSFPLQAKNWRHLIQNIGLSNDTIFKYKLPNLNLDSQCEMLRLASRNWPMEIGKISIGQYDVHIHLNRSPCLIREIVRQVISSSGQYGSSEMFACNVNVTSLSSKCADEASDLTHLRLSILENVTKKLLRFSSGSKGNIELSNIVITVNPVKNERTPTISCSPVLNEQGVKSSCTAVELYKKRTSHIRMMAQHKYGIQVKGNKACDVDFQELGKGCVTIEMLSNKPEKPIKISVSHVQIAHKEPSFIFYNCARLAALSKEFNKRIVSGSYPKLPKVEDVDFSLLNQPEEWELFYVYILQFPLMVKSCVQDIEKGILNPQNLVSFLAHLSSVFSVYYKRIRILTESREHLHAVLNARIYFLQALEIIFHNTLSLLDIDPVKEM